MEVLLNVEAITSQHNLKGLRRLYDSVEAQVRGLKALGVSSESYGSLLSSIIMNKLPQELRLIVSREVKEEEWQLDELMKIVEAEIKARERASNDISCPTRNPSRDLPTATTLVSNDSVAPKCSYCRQSHSSNSCKTITDPIERKHILKRTGRCFVCLRKYHMSRNCQSSLRCNNCNGRHHVSICTGGPAQNCTSPPQLNVSTPAGAPRQPPTVRNSSTGSQLPVPINNGSNTTSMYCGVAKIPVLLQTARACVFKIGSPNKTIEIRAIFDSGSQRSYITNKVKETLKLDSRSTETMLIKTFGSTRSGKQVCDVVSVGMILKNGGTLELSLLPVPLICEPLSGQPVTYVRENYEHISKLELADHCRGEDTLEIDILIGSDQYWKLVTGDVVCEASGPMAIHTKLGWVLSGPVEGFPCQATLVTTHALAVDTVA